MAQNFSFPPTRACQCSPLWSISCFGGDGWLSSASTGCWSQASCTHIESHGIVASFNILIFQATSEKTSVCVSSSVKVLDLEVGSFFSQICLAWSCVNEQTQPSPVQPEKSRSHRWSWSHPHLTVVCIKLNRRLDGFRMKKDPKSFFLRANITQLLLFLIPYYCIISYYFYIILYYFLFCVTYWFYFNSVCNCFNHTSSTLVSYMERAGDGDVFSTHFN